MRCFITYDLIPRKSKKRKKKCEDEENESKENVHPKNVPVNRFPADMNEKMRWIAVIPRVKQDKILSLKDPVICQKHWPDEFKTTTVNGKMRPHDPPSVFKGVPLSVLPTPPPNPRPTSRTSASVRMSIPDELSVFKENNSLTWEQLKINLAMKIRPMRQPVNTFIVGDEVQWILSADMMNGIPKYSLRVNNTF